MTVVAACTRRILLALRLRIVPVHPHPTAIVDDLDTIHVAAVVLDPLGAEDLAAGGALGAAHRFGEGPLPLAAIVGRGRTAAILIGTLLMGALLVGALRRRLGLASLRCRPGRHARPDQQQASEASGTDQAGKAGARHRGPSGKEMGGVPGAEYPRYGAQSWSQAVNPV